MRILSAEPQLFVTDMDRALRFYSGSLGFEPNKVYGEPPYWAQVGRGGAVLNLRLVSAPPFPEAFRASEPDAVSVTLTVDSCSLFAREFGNAGVNFHQEVKTEPWGAQTFIIKDPDGNLILFAGS